MRLPRSFLTDRRGTVAIMAAVGGGLACLLAAVAVDVGIVALEARKVQGAADLSALSAVRDLDRHADAARATAQDNLSVDVEVTPVVGTYLADRTIAAAARFTEGGNRPNAARVTLSRDVGLMFGGIVGMDSVRVTRTATAVIPGSQPVAAFSIGSRLARVEGGVANVVLEGLTGSRVDLTVMDYEALADARVEALTFLDAVALDMGVTAGDYDSLLEREIDAGRLLGILETVAGPDAGSGLSRLSQAADGMSVRLGSLLGLEADTPDAVKEGLTATVSALDIAVALIEVGAGDRQMKLDLGLPTSLSALDVWLAVGEPPNASPRMTITASGHTRIRTAQARLSIRARTSQKLSSLAQMEIPVLIEMAPAEAGLVSIDCTGPAAVTLGVRPGLVRTRIGRITSGDLDDFTESLTTQSATLLSVAGVATITGIADVRAEQAGDTAVLFRADEIADQQMKTVTATGLSGTTVSSALTGMNVQVQTLGLGLGTSGLTSSLAPLLAPVGVALDALIEPILALLGVKLGQADVTVHHATCPSVVAAPPVLVG